MHLLAHGGMLPQSQPSSPGQKSKKYKGVMQGFVMILAGILLTSIFGVMSAWSPGRISDVFGFFAALTAVICFVGGPLRMLFAAVFEEGAKRQPYISAPSYMPPAMPPPPQARVSALPPPAVNTQPWRARPDTAEIIPPTSVPDHTTKLLERDSEKE